MAKRVELTSEEHEDGTIWSAIVHCDGSIGEYVQTGCKCADSGNSGGIEPPESDWCDVANSISNKLKAVMGEWSQYAKDNGILADYIIALHLIYANQMPIGTLPTVTAYVSVDRTALEDMQWIDDGLLELEQLTVCSAYEALVIVGGIVGAAWADAFKNSLRANPEIDRCNTQGWDAIADFITLMGVEFWQYAAYEYSPGGSPLFWVPCDCEGTTLPDCAETEKLFTFDNPVTEGYTIVSGTQGSGYIGGVLIPSAGFPDYGIPGNSSPSSRGAYVRLDLNVKVAQLKATYRFRRFTGASSGVGTLLYCYDAAGQLLFGKPLGGSITAAQDTDNIATFNISAAGACIHHAILIVNFGTSDPAIEYIQILEAQTFLTIT